MLVPGFGSQVSCCGGPPTSPNTITDLARPNEPPRADEAADARARREAQVISAAYDAIFESIRHIDITRGRRMAEAREQVTHTR